MEWNKNSVISAKKSVNGISILAELFKRKWLKIVLEFLEKII